METTTNYSRIDASIQIYHVRNNSKLSMKYLLVCFALIGIISNSFAQTQPTKDWTLYKEMSGIKIYTKLNECVRNAGYDRKQVVVKLENTTLYNCNVHYHVDSYFNGVCKTCADPDGEYSINIQLKPNSTGEANCTTTLKGLTIFAGWNESGVIDAEFGGFDLSEIQVMIGSKGGHVESVNIAKLSKSNSFSSMTIDELKSAITDMEEKVKMVLKDAELYQESIDNGWYDLSKEEIALANKELKTKEETSKLKTKIKKSDLDSWPEDKQKYVNDHPDLYIITAQ
jgi:hypothetical protein